MYLLLVEDDLNLGQALIKLLRTQYGVQWVRTLSAARSHFAGGEYDLVLLDLGLPDGDGVEWLHSLRAAGSQTPVLILSARDALDDRVGGLDTGADDYLVKPFEPDELRARIRALLRRKAGTAGPRFEAGDLAYEPGSHQFFFRGEPFEVSPSERRLLVLLIQASGRTVSRERLLQQLYGFGEGADSNTLEVYIHALRRRIGKDRIETVRGIGYRLTAQ